MSAASGRLYDLLPVVYRERDSQQHEILRALTAVISDELSAVEGDIRGLYENWFIETCEDWVVPYIGDLLSVRGLIPIQTNAISQRAFVANTLHYRRRKGTAHVVEKLVWDLTGWPAYVVEYFDLLQTTQYMNHVRLFNTTPDLRQVDPLNLLETPFDRIPHTADVRRICCRRGKYNIPNIGIFLWRLQNYPLQSVTGCQAGAHHNYGYYFSPLGSPAPLFNFPAGSDLPEEQQVPAPIRPLDFYLDLQEYKQKYGSSPEPPEITRYYGEGLSFRIVKDGLPIHPRQIHCENLEVWSRPPAGMVGVDVVHGRISFAAGEEPSQGVTVSYNYGFSADLGGGPYDRRGRIPDKTGLMEFPVGAGKTYPTVAAAKEAWESPSFNRPHAVIRIYDSATYEAGITIRLPEDGRLLLDAENGERPMLTGARPLRIISTSSTEGEWAEFTLSGVLIEGSMEISGRLHLFIDDCTLVPGRSLDENGFPKHPDQASLTVRGTDATDMILSISRSILGPLEVPKDCQELAIYDSIVDAPVGRGDTTPARAAIAANPEGTIAGPVTILERVTVFGNVFVKELEKASEVIFTQRVAAEKRQTGCMRFSYAPAASRTPRRFQCQPDLAVAKREKELDSDHLPHDEYDRILHRVRPRFTSLRYGDAGFAQLSVSCPDEIKNGAENNSEMGVFHMLQESHRLANLNIALEEYLRFGLNAGIFLVD